MNIAAAQIMTRPARAGDRRRRRSRCRACRIGADGGAWADRPADRAADRTSCRRASVGRPDRHARGLHARARRRATPSRASGALPRARDEGCFDQLDRAGQGRRSADVALAKDEHLRPGTTHGRPRASCKPSFAAMGERGRLRCGGDAALSGGRDDPPRAHGRQLERHRRRRGAPCWSAASKRGDEGRPQAARAHPRVRHRSAASRRSC
ncbi:MAG: hypothetical protein MZV49_16575 [Rhodopseudomonas palustris]|nr:hypothetical protein [Rhodopseudomonas palustris]